MKSTTFKIAIAVSNRPLRFEAQDVSGYVFGLYGVHHERAMRRRWCVTHLPSGHSIASELPRDVAVRIATQLASDAPDAAADAEFGCEPKSVDPAAVRAWSSIVASAR